MSILPHKNFHECSYTENSFIMLFVQSLRRMRGGLLPLGKTKKSINYYFKLLFDATFILQREKNTKIYKDIKCSK